MRYDPLLSAENDLQGYHASWKVESTGFFGTNFQALGSLGK